MNQIFESSIILMIDHLLMHSNFEEIGMVQLRRVYVLCIQCNDGYDANANANY